MNQGKFRLPQQSRYEDMLLCELHGLKEIDKVRNLTLEPGDAVIASYPKTGTCMLQEIVWLVRNNADIEASRKTPNIFRTPYIDIALGDSLQAFERLPRPRTMKTHVPWRMLPKDALQGQNKVVCTLRNPKDLLVSYYHFHRMCGHFGYFKGSWDEFFKFFRDNDYLLLYGNPVDHMLGYWKHRDDDNVLLVFYEDMMRDRLAGVRKIANFLGVNLDDGQLEAVAEATSFDVMKANPTTNYRVEEFLPPDFDFNMRHEISPFMRNGKVGDWKNWFSEEQSRIVDKMCEDKLAGSGLEFCYE